MPQASDPYKVFALQTAECMQITRGPYYNAGSDWVGLCGAWDSAFLQTPQMAMLLFTDHALRGSESQVPLQC